MENISQRERSIDAIAEIYVLEYDIYIILNPVKLTFLVVKLFLGHPLEMTDCPYYHVTVA